MERIKYTSDFICPKCGIHTSLLCKLDGTYQAHCGICNEYYDVEVAPMTNADRIRSMTDEELAEYLCAMPALDCYICQRKEPCNHGERECEEVWLEWLKSDSEQNADSAKTVQ